MLNPKTHLLKVSKQNQQRQRMAVCLKSLGTCYLSLQTLVKTIHHGNHFYIKPDFVPFRMTLIQQKY